ncbi:hypothetical protein [Agrobacterium vitis]|uniref:hypothetical protein n=1 Tax=Agrobacterium vitis TaxID=373 RepID=UPI0008723E14|nr:hypothetical protein [Agrobacterium vitis]MCM2453373.1 hypothetical protein [Agrobacterium vitis]MCM2470946.1 hypothetical protein [Agrobacterium vitis]MUO70062.1 hypothetical protein [Agrobacterium vitis]
MTKMDKVWLITAPIMCGVMLFSAYVNIEGASARRELAASNTRLSEQIEKLNAAHEERKCAADGKVEQ